MRVVERVLAELDLADRPLVPVFNKMDVVADPAGFATRVRELHPGALTVSTMRTTASPRSRQCCGSWSAPAGRRSGCAFPSPTGLAWRRSIVTARSSRGRRTARRSSVTVGWIAGRWSGCSREGVDVADAAVGGEVGRRAAVSERTGIYLERVYGWTAGTDPSLRYSRAYVRDVAPYAVRLLPAEHLLQHQPPVHPGELLVHLGDRRRSPGASSSICRSARASRPLFRNLRSPFSSAMPAVRKLKSVENCRMKPRSASCWLVISVPAFLAFPK